MNPGCGHVGLVTRSCFEVRSRIEGLIRKNVLNIAKKTESSHSSDMSKYTAVCWPNISSREVLKGSRKNGMPPLDWYSKITDSTVQNTVKAC